MKQRSTQQAPRLQFTRDEQSDPVMKKPIRRAQRAADTFHLICCDGNTDSCSAYQYPFFALSV